MKFKHEFDANGRHRLGVSHKVKGDLTQDGPYRFGDWASYRSPAVIKLQKTRYVAVSGYYEGSVEFPDPSKVYKIEESGYPVQEV